MEPAAVAQAESRSAQAGVHSRSARLVGLGPNIPRHFLWLADILSLIAAFQIAYMAAPRVKALALAQSSPVKPWVQLFSPELGGEFRPLNEVAWVLLVMSAVTLLSLQGFGGYRPLMRQSRTRVVVSTLVSPLVGLSSVSLIVFTFRSPSWSRLFVFLFTALAALFLCAYRVGFRWYRRQRIASGFYAKSVVCIGPSQALEWLTGYFAGTAPAEYEVIGYLSLSDDQPTPNPPLTVDGAKYLRRLGSVDEFTSLLVHRPIHEVIAVPGPNGAEWLQKIIQACDYFRVTLRIVPEVLLFGQLRDLESIYRSDPLRLPEIVLKPRDFESDAVFVKRVIDILVSATLLVLLLPLFLTIALAIKFTTRKLPVFYRWEVVGYSGKRFTGYKFSTMVADAEQLRAALIPLNEMQGPVFKVKNDPRVTPFGRFLRKYSLNELPQLWSVLKGDMSLVGPRPAFPHELERYELWHKRKLCVRPGITCLWQISGRNKVSRFDDCVKMDLEYIDKWSLCLDFKILIRTVWTVVAGTGS